MQLHILDLPFSAPGFSDKISSMKAMFPDAIVHGVINEEVADPFNADGQHWKIQNHLAIASLREVIKPEDIILNMAGLPQLPVNAAFPAHLSVEAGIGYRGHCLKYRVWESYAWMHHCLPLDARHTWFDDVIYPAFDADSVGLMPKEDYVLFLGRLEEDKGVHIAVEIAKAAKERLVVAGGGDNSKLSLYAEYVGFVSGVDKYRLLARAKCLIVPTLYLEPFGRVAMEAMMCGTPVVATDWGAFTETLTHHTGRTFRSLEEGVIAVKQCVSLLEPKKIRAEAIEQFSLPVIRRQWQQYFRRLSTLHGDGWYHLPASLKT